MLVITSCGELRIGEIRALSSVSFFRFDREFPRFVEYSFLAYGHGTWQLYWIHVKATSFFCVCPVLLDAVLMRLKTMPLDPRVGITSFGFIPLVQAVRFDSECAPVLGAGDHRSLCCACLVLLPLFSHYFSFDATRVGCSPRARGRTCCCSVIRKTRRLARISCVVSDGSSYHRKRVCGVRRYSFVFICLPQACFLTFFF